LERPRLPTDEATEYLATQAIADFLASNEAPSLDGILYPSVQTGHLTTNVVLLLRTMPVDGFCLLQQRGEG
jgi:hypothetical protein